MGKMEIEAQSVRRRGYLQTAVLTTLAVSGMLVVAMVAPNTLQLLGKFGVIRRLRDQTSSALTRLARSGFVTFENVGGKKYARITEKGRHFLLYEQQKAALSVGERRRWDRRFRIVMFDIPERRRSTRIKLRTAMQQSGFLRLQDSVWVYPYDCEDFIALLKADLHIGKDVLYTIVEKIENDGWIRTHFKLPRS